MNVAFCQECEPAVVIGVNVGVGLASHAVGDRVHRAKVIEVDDADRPKNGEAVTVYLDRLSKKYREKFAHGTPAAAIKSYDCPSFELYGGLGDVLHSIHTTDRYDSLMKLRGKERRLVVLMSHNPHSQELFQWHPNAKQFDVLYLGYRAPWGTEQRKKLGVPEPLLNQNRVPTPIEYYPGPDDREPLSQLARMKYVAFCLTGSNNNDRDIPVALAERAADEAIRLGFEVVQLGRTYKTHAFHGSATVSWPHVEPTLKPRNGITRMVDRLSVPGTCRALAMADAVLCAHSALCLASWWLRRPTFVLYPDTSTNLFKQPLGYGFGRDYPETRYRMYSDFKIAQLTEWLNRVKVGDYGWAGKR